MSGFYFGWAVWDKIIQYVKTTLPASRKACINKTHTGGIMKKRLTRTDDGYIGGVCGGIAEYFGWDPTIVRVIWLIAIIFGIGSPILIYIILWIIIPER